MKRRLIVATLASALIFGCLTGCSNQPQSTSDKPDASIENTETGNKLEDEDPADIAQEDNLEGGRPNPFEEKPVLSKSDLTEEQLIFRDAIQAKYDEIVEKHRKAGDDVSMFEDIYITDAFVYNLLSQGITTYDDFWNYIVKMTDAESDKFYAEEDAEDRYETTYVLTVSLGCYQTETPEEESQEQVEDQTEDKTEDDESKEVSDLGNTKEDPGRYKPPFHKP